MGKNNQARRAAKAKQRARHRAQGEHAGRGGSPGPGGGGPGPGRHRTTPPGFDEAGLTELMWAAASGSEVGRQVADPWTALARLAELSSASVMTGAERVLLAYASALWQHGWQPTEVKRHARVSGRSGPVARLVELVVGVECARRLAEELDPRWRGQAEELAVPAPAAAPGWLARWVADECESGSAAHPVIAESMSALCALPAIDELIPPPGSHAAARRPSASATADPVLQRVRNLLAKAESTEFEAEAEALTAKAHEMITRHAIDAALVDGDVAGERPEGRPTLIRVPVDPPYADAKALLLQTVAHATRCRAVSIPQLFHSTVVGLPSDLAAVEVLFTSLLVQAQHALTEAARSAAPGTRTRSQSYRSAFLVAYTHRIGERLEEINEHVYGSVEGESARFLPVLRSQSDAVDDLLEQRFGTTTAAPVRAGYDSAGWATGRMAADRARLAHGDLEGRAS